MLYFNKRYKRKMPPKQLWTEKLPFHSDEGTSLETLRPSIFRFGSSVPFGFNICKFSLTAIVRDLQRGHSVFVNWFSKSWLQPIYIDRFRSIPRARLKGQRSSRYSSFTLNSCQWDSFVNLPSTWSPWRHVLAINTCEIFKHIRIFQIWWFPCLTRQSK